MTNTNTLYTKFHALEDSLNETVYERRQEIHTAILAVLAKKHHFQLGAPGTAKSYLVTELFRRIGGTKEGDLFRYLLSKFTNPDELFGPPNLLLFKEKGIFVRNTEKRLPEARFAFLDECFKGSSAILNTNLSIMNERWFDNGPNDPHVPLISLFGASNELPQGEELAAMWDRLHLRHMVSPLQETTNFMRMLAKDANEEVEPIVTLDDIYTAHELVDNVKIPSDVLEALKNLRSDLAREGIEPSERRWRECMAIIRAEAFFNGNTVAEVNDLRPLMHALWGTQINTDDIKLVRKLVLELANPIDRKASELLDAVLELQTYFRTALDDQETEKGIRALAVECYDKLDRTADEIEELRKQNKESGKKSQILDELIDRAKDFSKILLKRGFDIDEE